MPHQDLKISIVQTNIIWELPEQNRSLLTAKMAHLQGQQHIIVLPEMFTTGFSMAPQYLAEPMDGPTVLWMQQQAHSLRSIITGSVIIADDGHYYNRLLWVLPNGQVSYYNKRHLFSYAGEQQHYTAGTRRLIAQVNGWKICLNICYDLRFPVWTRNTDHYDLLLYVANWPEQRNDVWEALLKARAIENMSFVVGANRIGIDGNGHPYIGNSSIYSPLGHLMARGASTDTIIQHTLHHTDITNSRSCFGFLADQDDFLLR